jgi:hypothetical protein
MRQVALIVPGQLAFVIGSFTCPQNIGRIVRVVRRITPGQRTACGALVSPALKASYPDVEWYEVQAVGSPLIVAYSDYTRRPADYTVVARRHLRMIEDWPGWDEVLLYAGLPTTGDGRKP